MINRSTEEWNEIAVLATDTRTILEQTDVSDVCVPIMASAVATRILGLIIKITENTKK